MRFFTCVYICDLFALKFAYYLLDSIFDVYVIYVSPIRGVWYLQPLSKLSKTFSCIKLKTIQ